MDHEAIKAVLDDIDDAVVDERGEPDGPRLGRFKVGWRRFTRNGHAYGEGTLSRLTWDNLGNRLARSERFPGGDTDEDLKAVFEVAARGWRDGTLRLTRRV